MEFTVIEDFPKYEISECGIVRHRKNRRPLSYYLREGYPSFTAMTDVPGEAKYPKLHRMLAIAFIPNPDNLPEVNHKDKDRTNYSLDNLEWCSKAYNMEHAFAKHYIVEHPCGRIEPVYNLAKFARKHGLKQGALANVARGARNHHKKFKVTPITN